jgi:hypothetical protein
MSRLVFLLLVVGLIWLVWRYRKQSTERVRDTALPAPAACPRCNRMLSLSDVGCANCGRQGTVRRTVYRDRDEIAETRFDCRNCGTSVTTLPCPHCQTNVAGVFAARRR